MSYRAVGYVIEECREVRSNHHNVLVAMAFVARDDMGLLVWASERKIADTAHISPTTLRGQAGKEGRAPASPGAARHVARARSHRARRDARARRRAVARDRAARRAGQVPRQDAAEDPRRGVSVAAERRPGVVRRRPHHRRTRRTDCTTVLCSGRGHDCTTRWCSGRCRRGRDCTCVCTDDCTHTASQGDAVSEEYLEVSGTTRGSDVLISPREGLEDQVAQSDADLARARAQC
jgi:hypothetical protein